MKKFLFRSTLGLLIGALSARENLGLQIRRETLLGQKVNLTICHLSDIHFPLNGVTLKSILNQCRLEKPDIICVSGDLYDDSIQSYDVLINFLYHLLEIAPVYYVRGNHELRVKHRPQIEKEIEEAGVKLLKNESVKLGPLCIIGVDELNRFQRFELNEEQFNVILAHHPEDLKKLMSNEHIDLILSGHAHGGQIRIFDQGLFAPGQGILPKYTKGLHPITNSLNLNISAGIGFSSFPQRINNRPEIVIIKLSSQNNV